VCAKGLRESRDAGADSGYNVRLQIDCAPLLVSNKSASNAAASLFSHPPRSFLRGDLGRTFGRAVPEELQEAQSPFEHCCSIAKHRSIDCQAPIRALVCDGVMAKLPVKALQPAEKPIVGTGLAPSCRDPRIVCEHEREGRGFSRTVTHAKSIAALSR
jgi:hypothetical protein